MVFINVVIFNDFLEGLHCIALYGMFVSLPFPLLLLSSFSSTPLLRVLLCFGFNFMANVIFVSMAKVTFKVISCLVSRRSILYHLLVSTD